MKRKKKIWLFLEVYFGGGDIFFSRAYRIRNIFVQIIWWKLWNYRSCIIAGCYSEPDDQDQIRIYPREPQLSNRYMTAVVLSSQIFLIDSLWDKLIVYCADGKLSMYSMSVLETHTSGEWFRFIFQKKNIPIVDWWFYFIVWFFLSLLIMIHFRFICR